MKAKFDMPKLERSLKRFAADFGDTSAQAVVRWGVQTCRESAFEAQPFGRKQTRTIHERSIIADAMRVVHAVREATPSMRRSRRWLDTPQAVNDWMDQNRTSNNRTRKLSDADKRICLFTTMKKAVGIRMKMAGIAKGGFLGAGQDLASAQTGMDRVNIGRNFFGYAQKHARFGNSVKPRSGFNPTARLNNTAAHTSKDYVIKTTAMKKAMQFGLRKTINWYRAALRRIDKKKP